MLMRQTTNKQTGSAHVLIVILIVVALIGGLGWVYYDNFIARKPAETASTPVASKGDGQAGVVTSEYCLDEAKLCFNYPASWSIETTTAKREVPTDDGKTVPYQSKSAIVLTGSGEKMLYLETGIGQIGGACLPEEQEGNSIEVLEATALDLKVDVYEASREYQSANLYAVKVVWKEDGKYTPEILLTQKKSLQKVAVLGICDGMYASVFGQKYNPIPGYSQMQFASSSFENADGTRGSESYATRESAINELNSADVKEAWKTLTSAHYKQ